MQRHYRLRCQVCRAEFEDDGFLLQCPENHTPSLLISEYQSKKFEIDEDAEGIYRYGSWLPAQRKLAFAGKTVTYRSESLCRKTDLPNLWIAFNGYWPEKGASLETATFKEIEACAVLSRIPKEHSKTLVVASAGNTATAFASLCSKNSIPCLIIIPETGLSRMQFADPLNPCVKIVSLVGFTDYFDAITLANRVSELDGFFLEGGVKNIARRDGLGTVMLRAVEGMGKLPDLYFQAVGSGCGAIAAFEVSQRLIADGRFGRKLPSLMLSQNLPFAPMYLSWKSGRRDLIKINRDDGKKQILEIIAHVLSNRQPAYSVQGGVYDILKESGGDMLVADNVETLRAMEIFEDSEEIDIDPAAGVAFASLISASKSARIDRRSSVLLHVTGGGWYRGASDRKLISVKPSLQVDGEEAFGQATLKNIVRLFQ